MTAVPAQETLEFPGVDTGTDPASNQATARPGDAPRAFHRAGQRAHDDLPFSDHCGARWSGTQTSHCARCHQTFGGVGHFDQHRKDGQCQDPAKIGLTLLPGRAFRCWGRPDGTGTTANLPPTEGDR